MGWTPRTLSESTKPTFDCNRRMHRSGGIEAWKGQTRAELAAAMADHLVEDGVPIDIVPAWRWMA
jgi:hypothetical protein